MTESIRFEFVPDKGFFYFPGVATSVYRKKKDECGRCGSKTVASLYYASEPDQKLVVQIEPHVKVVPVAADELPDMNRLTRRTKGDIVQVAATVHTARMVKPLESTGETLIHEPESGRIKTCLFRVPCTPWRGLVIGRSFLQTGEYDSGTMNQYGFVIGAELRPDKFHPVLVIEPLDTERWLRPRRVLESDTALL